MKLLKSLILALLFAIPLNSFAQSGPPAPSSGVWVVIDTQYTVGSYTLGQTKAKIYFKNTTGSKITGYQYRVFYDKSAFSSASAAIVGSTTNLNLLQNDSNANGFLTLALVYTGSSSTYTIPDEQALEITFNHVSGPAFYSLSGIDSLKWSGAYTYNHLAASQTGLDTTMYLHSWGGSFKRIDFKYQGRFVNVTGTPAKNLTLALEKKPKSSGTWTIHNTYITDISGRFSLNEIIDTSYYDVRLAVNGDTMNVGNVISTADAALINQWVLKTATPQEFDFYTGDINNSNNITITDAYGVYGRIAGRFTSWPNNVKDIKFFTSSEYNTIINNPTNNYTSTIPGVTNFTFQIYPGQPDSVTYYVCVTGDANRTGYQMARVSPITMLSNPVPGVPSQTQNIIDMKVEYDFSTTTMEINMPQIQVTEGSIVDIPVTVKTNGVNISALQLGMLYDEDVLEFKELVNSDKSMFWLSYLNPKDGIVEWGGYDPSANKDYLIPDEYKIFTLRFVAKKPQGEWATSPLWTSRKFSGNHIYRDMNISPTNNMLVVFRIANINGLIEDQIIKVYPNPTTGEINVNFEIKNGGHVKLFLTNLQGVIIKTILDDELEAGVYSYSDNIQSEMPGVYTTSLQTKDGHKTLKLIKQ